MAGGRRRGKVGVRVRVTVLGLGWFGLQVKITG